MNWKYMMTGEVGVWSVGYDAELIEDVSGIYGRGEHVEVKAGVIGRLVKARPGDDLVTLRLDEQPVTAEQFLLVPRTSLRQLVITREPENVRGLDWIRYAGRTDRREAA